MHRCRACDAPLEIVFADLGMQPLANAYLMTYQRDSAEPFWPLRAYVCERCLLVQLPSIVPAEAMFAAYDYRSGVSDSWRAQEHDLASALAARFEPRLVADIGCNDGTLLRAFKDHDIRAEGVDPAREPVDECLNSGLLAYCAYWGLAFAKLWGARPDLIVAQNVLAHVPDINDFLAGVTHALADDGVFIVEFPWLLNLIRGRQWDTIYHEHYSYLSLLALTSLFGRHDLRIFDVDRLATHGGSLRVYACRAQYNGRWPDARVAHALDEEGQSLLHQPSTYAAFASVPEADREIVRAQLGRGIRTAGYGAPAKGTVFLNYCGLGRDRISFIVDSTPAKQGKLVPGVRIPIVAPDVLGLSRPERIVVLPWNWYDEIRAKIVRDCDWHPLVWSKQHMTGVDAPIAAPAAA